MSSTRSLHFSSSFAISCGMVTLDFDQSMVLLIRLCKTGEFLLPKGRKDVNETLEAAALRETFEETGVHVEPLPLSFPTLATNATSTNRGGADDKNCALTFVTEPIAVTQRHSDGVLKMIFWFAAKGDSTLPPESGTREEHEDFETIWASFKETTSILSFDDDRKVAAKVIETATKCLQ